MSDDIKSLEARVARIEAALSQKPGAAVPQIGAITDPAGPWGGGWPVWGGGYRYPVHWPIGDPAPVDYSRIYVDPPAWPWPVAGGGWGGYRPPWHGPIPDPAPIDYSRLPVEQLEAALHSINAEKARLASAEAQVTQHLENAKKKKKA
jgi:hypothetical protein